MASYGYHENSSCNPWSAIYLSKTWEYLSKFEVSMTKISPGWWRAAACWSPPSQVQGRKGSEWLQGGCRSQRFEQPGWQPQHFVQSAWKLQQHPHQWQIRCFAEQSRAHRSSCSTAHGKHQKWWETPKLVAKHDRFDLLTEAKISYLVEHWLKHVEAHPAKCRDEKGQNDSQAVVALGDGSNHLLSCHSRAGI